MKRSASILPVSTRHLWMMLMMGCLMMLNGFSPLVAQNGDEEANAGEQVADNGADAGAASGGGGDATAGKALFKDKCNSCHAMGSDLTGPALGGAVGRWEDAGDYNGISGREWLAKWIVNWQDAVDEGYPYAVEMQNYNGSAMNSFTTLKDEEVNNIIAYIEEWKPEEKVSKDGPEGFNFEDDKRLVSMVSMIRFLVFIVIMLLILIAIQIVRAVGPGFLEGLDLDKLNASLMITFFILGLAGAVWSSSYYSQFYLFNNAASEHGREIDQIFWITMTVVLTVATLTNGLLFIFAFRYRHNPKRKAKFYPENHKLELVWTVVPALTLTALIILGIRVWNKVMVNDPPKDALMVELNAQQFGWNIRYAGKDNKLGDINLNYISGSNILGIDYVDEKSRADAKDDFLAEDLMLPVNTDVVLKIRSRDVLHSAYLPHFRVKMDAVPGLPTRFFFKPITTTDEMREKLKKKGKLLERD